MSDFDLRPMQAADLPAILAIQARCYGPALQESADALASRLALEPDTCWVAALPGQAPAAYLFSHAWPQATLPPWNGHLAAAWPATEPLTWFIHDMAVAPAGRGARLAARLYDAARDVAMTAGLRTSHLIAVQSADAYWRRLGYAPVDAARHVEKLASYGEGAVVMGCRLA
ncbi:GNAT family N-acetyltransferase [Cupriavidus pauculus]|uniref:GNAT family N-acetyltransferase n=1 Tax=Cupriavidus pauculus TaxID=82633 RepID=A0A3G8GYH1_9BURK|nr:GNAT family N-acetyltransferase [Cupriavidus pauculus]AZG13204.1 GNAT family N-acetyltransferase [Cupriavidus pauculus]